jgi:hypothetical protein
MLQPKKKIDKNAATRQDSINVKKDSKRLLEEYLAKGYEPSNAKFPNETLDQSLNRIKNKTGKTEIIKNNIRNSEKYNSNDFRVDINENQFRQRESANGVLNLDIEPALYDKRISPVRTINLMGTKGGTYNDGVSIPSYDTMEIGKKADTIIVNKPTPKIVKPTTKVNPIVTPPIKKSIVNTTLKPKSNYSEYLPVIADTLSKETVGVNKIRRTGERAVKTLKTTNKTKPVVKAFAGAAIGAVAGPLISGITGIIASNKARKEAKALEKENEATNFNQTMIEQSIYDDQFAYNNKNDLPVYSKGGKINKPMPIPSKPSTTGKLDAVGGDLVPISNNAELVVGNKHSEKKIDNSYGVTLSKNNEPIVNVEDKEVVVNNNLVFSDKLKKGKETFAQIALKLNNRIGELEDKSKQLVKPNQIFANNRTIEGLKKKNEMLFAEQDAIKKSKIGNTEETVNVTNGKVPMAKDGLDIDSIPEPKMNLAANLAPLLIDNIANLIINKNTPKVPKPLLNRAPILDTRINANPQLAEINSSLSSNNKFIENNTNNSGVARANITANNLKGAEMKSNVLAQKQQGERQAENQQKQIVYNNSVSNNALIDQYKQDVYTQRVQKNNNTSANITNAVEDFTAVRKDYLTRQSEDDLIDLSLSNDPTGEKSRSYGKVAKTMRPSTKALIKANMINFNNKRNASNPFTPLLSKTFNSNVFSK